MDLFFWGEDKHHKNTHIVGMLTFNGFLLNICYDKSIYMITNYIRAYLYIHKWLSEMMGHLLHKVSVNSPL